MISIICINLFVLAMMTCGLSYGDWYTRVKGVRMCYHVKRLNVRASEQGIMGGLMLEYIWLLSSSTPCVLANCILVSKHYEIVKLFHLH